MVEPCIAAQVEVLGPRRDSDHLPASQVKAEFNITKETRMGNANKGAKRSFWKYLTAKIALSVAMTLSPAT